MAEARAWRVWVTRARPGAEATAERVRALGHDPLAAPLIETRPLPAAPPDLAGVATLAFTSAAGVRAYADLHAGRDLPVFAVGDATAAAARGAGFGAVHHADGNARDLAALLLRAAPAGRVLVPGAREPAFDLPAALAAAGVPATALPLYETHPVRPPPAAALAELAAGRLDAVLLHSPSAARALEGAAADVAAPPHPPTLFALSAACLPSGLTWPARIAVAPRERDLVALLPHLDTGPPAR